MFLEADFEKSKMNIYRDHFLHQIRNAYFGFLLIWKFEFYKNIKAAIETYKDTGFSTFINMYARKENSQKSDFNINVFYAQIIKKTWFMAALFHDIGYPISYYYRVSAKMDKYMPYLRVLDKRSQMDFIDLSALLCDSYLFKMVKYEELKNKYEKLDHGMLSAICLLLNYYHGGLVHQLSNQDRCSIELAAYAIYLHTRKYSIQDEDCEWVKPSFVEDPIAYLLRICDDLQEWSRVYFIIGNNPNVLICDKCYGLVKNENKNKNIYTCDCSDGQKQFEKITSIKYRKINLVGACEKLIINDDGQKVIFKLEYNLIKLLEVLELDKQYAKYRYKELENLKKLFKNQILLPRMDLDYFVSNNPRRIKAEIIKMLIKKIDPSVEMFSFDVLKDYKSKLEVKIMEIYTNKGFNNENKEAFRKCVQHELGLVGDYLKEISNKNISYNDMEDIIINSCELPDDALKNIFLYKIIYEKVCLS